MKIKCNGMLAGFEKYFNLHYDEKTQAFVLPEERCSVVERELDLAGYFCIITSEKMSAKEAIELYKSRDTSEKLFRGDKSYLGNKSIRVYSEESARAKICASNTSYQLFYRSW